MRKTSFRNGIQHDGIRHDGPGYGWFRPGSVRRRWVSALLLIVIVVAGGTSGGQCDAPLPNPNGNTPVITNADHVLGSADAPITVVEYSSYACGFCSNFALSEFPTIKEQYIDTGKVRWVCRHAVSSNTGQAAARAAECASDQGAFFDYRDLLLANPNNLNEESFKDHATTLGLDRSLFDACLASGEKQSRVEEDLASAHALGVPATPTYFVDAEMVRGFKTAEAMGAIINQHLAGQ